MNQGGAYSVNSQDNLATSTHDIGTDIAEHITSISYLRRQFTTRISRDGPDVCNISWEATNEDMSSAAFSGHGNNEGQFAMTTMTLNNTSLTALSRLAFTHAVNSLTHNMRQRTE